MADANMIQVDFSLLSDEERKYFQLRALNEHRPVADVIVEVLQQKASAMLKREEASQR